MGDGALVRLERQMREGTFWLFFISWQCLPGFVRAPRRRFADIPKISSGRLSFFGRHESAIGESRDEGDTTGHTSRAEKWWIHSAF